MLSNRELELLLELAWWRQEYGRGVSYETRLALLRPAPVDRSYVRHLDKTGKGSETHEARLHVARQPLQATFPTASPLLPLPEKML